MSIFNRFTVCVLLYGDYPHLAHRCLSSLPSDAAFKTDTLRIGLNAVSAATRKIVADYGATNIWEYSENQLKYPVMREMLHGISPVKTDYMMWFDDDSYIRERAVREWFEKVAKTMETEKADVLGSLYTRAWEGNQRQFIMQQPWYRGKSPYQRKNRLFPTGGWWTIRASLLYDYDYPWPYLRHCGGDALLGELCIQQDLKVVKFRDGVAINADEHGNESEAVRRGVDERPYGAHWKPDAATLLNTATTRHANHLQQVTDPGRGETRG